MVTKNKWYSLMERFLDDCFKLLSKIPSHSYQGKVMMYHIINKKKNYERQSCECSLEQFKEDLGKLQNRGFTFVSMRKMYEIIEKKKRLKFAVITFDDIDESIVRLALPILNQKKIPFTLFIATSFINKSDKVNSIELKKISKNSLCTIAAHSIKHSKLRFIKNSEYEIIESRKKIENELDIKIDFFAYPYGKINAVSKKNIMEVKEAGYKLAFGTIFAEVTPLTVKLLSYYYLPRLVKVDL